MRLPPYLRKRTQLGHRGMSQKCHEETHAPQQNLKLFDHLTDDGKRLRRHIDAKRTRYLEVHDEFEFSRRSTGRRDSAVDGKAAPCGVFRRIASFLYPLSLRLRAGFRTRRSAFAPPS